MLSKEGRLKKKRDFDQVFKKSKGLRDDFLILRSSPNNLEQGRFAVIVSQKVSKKAVMRNKIRRRIMAVVKDKIIKMKTSRDVVLIALPGLELKSFKEIKESIDKLFEKSKLIS